MPKKKIYKNCKNKFTTRYCKK